MKTTIRSRPYDDKYDDAADDADDDDDDDDYFSCRPIFQGERIGRRYFKRCADVHFRSWIDNWTLTNYWTLKIALVWAYEQGCNDDLFVLLE